MREIQDVGIEILNNNPKKIYIFLGSEYVIKEKYIQILDKHYRGNHREVNSFSDLQSIGRGVSLLPLPPTTYVVRYDNDFIKQLSDRTVRDFEYLNFNGTAVFIYEQESDAKKLDKYLPEYTVTFFPVSKHLQKKYLLSDYNTLSEQTVDDVINFNLGYTMSDHICRSLSYCCDNGMINTELIRRSFIFQHYSTISDLQMYFANRNFAGIYRFLENTNIDISNVHYKFLSVIIDLMKVRKSSYIESAYKKYASKWTDEDLHNMFDNIFNELVKLRTKTSDIYNSIMYIATLLCFRKIPKIVR